MAKSDRPIDRIDLDTSYNDQVEPTWRGMKQINAFDTETHNGTVFMLSYAIGDDSGVIGNPDVSELSAEIIFDKITAYSCRSAINIWYNLDFDANAILSGILSKQELTEISVKSETETTVNGIDYNIRYIKGKFLRIQDENRNTYEHYDISQFFYTSLDNAAEQWLGENKKEGIDTSKFGDKDYIKQQYDEIAKYAEKDATLTQELANELTKEAENLDIPMGKPISTGYLSAEYLRANTSKKPNFHHSKMQSMFWDSYYGGRFEVFERGYVGEVAAPDINSAYPAIMKDLPNPATVDWVGYSNEMESSFSFDNKPFSFEDVCKADYGVVRATVTTDPNVKIQPFARKIDGKVTYPVMMDTEITVIKPILEFAIKQGIVIDYELHEAWLGNANEDTEYPFKFIGDIYAQRKVFEILEGLLKKGQLLKIVLNSLYGKTCQTTKLLEVIDLSETGEIELDLHQSIQPKDYLSLNQRENLKDDEVIIASYTGGRRFNPFFASYITGMTRLELHKQVVQNDLVEDTVMFATDCIMVKKDAYEASDFNELIKVPEKNDDREEFRKKAKESLGYWDFDYKGKAFIVGSGVYEVDFGYCTNEDCENYEGDCPNRKHRVKTQTRGFQEHNLDGTLLELARESNDGITISNERPLTIGEVLISPERGNVSEFVEDSKTLQPDFDTKRNWERESPTFNDLVATNETSEPLNLAEMQAELLQEAQEELKETTELPESVTRLA